MKKVSFRNIFPVVLAIVSLTLSVSFAFAKNSKGSDNNGNGNNSSSEEKSNPGQSKKETVDNSLNEKTKNQGESTEIRNEETRKIKTGDDLDSGNGDGMEVEKNISKKLRNGLEAIASAEEEAGNTQASKRLRTMINQRTQEEEQIGTAIENIENRGKVKTFLFGTDYKNLGELRSALVQNRNQIRKLIQMLGQVQSEESETAIKAQISTLLQERINLKSIIQSAENQSSLFGWMLKIVNGYENGIYEEEEHELEQEVKDMVEQAMDVPETTEEQQ